MKFTSLYLFLILLASNACGTESNSSTAAETNAQDNTPTLMDAVNAAVEKGTQTKTVRPDTLDYKLKTPQDAIDWMKKSGHWDKYKQGIIPGIASQSLTYAEKLLRNSYPYFVIADKGSMHVILYDKYGIEQKAYKMACSRNYGHKHKFRDNRTPEGFFYAQGIYDSTDWKYTNDDGYTSPAKGVYGPRFIRIAPMVGIHGTNSPNSPGLRVSHGCIRLHNTNILDLVKYAQKGMPIIVNPGPKDDAVNKQEDCHIVMLNLGKIKETIISTAEADAIVKRQNGEQEKTSTDSTEKKVPADEDPKLELKEPADGHEPDSADTPEHPAPGNPEE